ncbi:hypothetical protein C3Y87_04630 [Carbonactinospora thermoautotrophica]|uniref:SpoIIE family protein phosphatase n=1 Tax=Carbonactinospora thermoautotrophica TaxID=1469144 RepID=UPI0022721DFE|nr:SpoIIE family protein phosphatase [Carbonactinospora thermoautotrophica]MCX9190708.1 hypothetical protein [Carbonactinospora thermoautotrophica]
MRRVALVGCAVDVESRLRHALSDVTVEVLGPDDLTGWLGNDDPAVVVLGPAVDNAERIVQRLRLQGARLPCVVLRDARRSDPASTVLSLMAGEDVRELDAGQDLPAVIAGMLARAEGHHRYRATLSAVQQQLDVADTIRHQIGDRLFGDFLSHAPIGAVVLDDHGVLRGWNHRAGRLLDLAEPEALGLPFAELFPEPDRPRLRALLGASHAEEGEEALFERLGSDGRFQAVELNLQRVTDPAGEQHLLVVVRDLTVRVLAQRELAERTRQTSLAAEVGAAVASSDPLPERLRRCCEAVVGRLDAALARIWVLNEASQTLELRASAGMYTHLDGESSRIPVSSGRVGQVAATRRPHLSNALLGELWREDREWARSEGVVAFAGYPLVSQDRLVGVLALYARHLLAASTIEALEMIADQIAVGIAEDRLLRDLRAAESRYRHLVEDVEAIVWEAHPTTGRFSFVSPRAEQLLGYPVERWLAEPGFLTGIVHPEDGHLLTTVGLPAETEQREYRLRAADGRVVWVYEVVSVLRDADGEADRVRGVMVDLTRRKLEERRQTAQYAVTRVLTDAENPKTAFPAVLRVLGEHLGIDAAALWLLDGRRRRLSRAESWMVPELAESAVTTRLLIEEGYGLPGRVWATGEPAWVVDLGADTASPWAREAVATGLQHAFCVPIRVAGSFHGALECYSRAPAPRDEGLLRLMDSITSQIGHFLTRARAEEERAAVAEALQRPLLPPRLPEIPGVRLAARYRPHGHAITVGGDFYDVFPTPDGAWALALGDVSGKGPEAAAITGIARHTLWAASQHSAEPGYVLDLLNQAILRDETPRFCTLVYVRLQPEEDGRARLDVACAGHPPPLLLHADGTGATLGVRELPVGFFPDVKHSVRTLYLGPGDSFVLYTDGITEGGGAGDALDADELLATVRSAGALHADDLADRILADALRRWGDRLRDDLAVLVVQVPAA